MVATPRPLRFRDNVLWTGGSQAALLVLGLLTGAITARALGPSGRGVLAVALLVPQMAFLLLNAGIPAANVYYSGLRRFEPDELAANSVSATIVGTGVGVGVVGALAFGGLLPKLLPHVPPMSVALAMTLLPVLLLKGHIGGILHGTQRLRALGLIEMAQGAVLLAGTVLVLVALRGGVNGALAAALAAALVAVIATVTTLGISVRALLPRWRGDVVRPVLRYGMVGSLGNMMQFFTYRLDALLMNIFVGQAVVGIYSVSVRLAELVWLVPNAVAFAIFPKAAAASREEMDDFTPRAFWATSLLCLAIAAGLAATGSIAIRVLYGSAFTAAYRPLLALLPGVVLLGGGAVLTNEIAGRGHPKYNTFSAALTLAVTVALDVILIPRYGAVGAGVASSCAYAVTMATALASYKWVTHVSFATFVAPLRSPRRLFFTRVATPDASIESAQAPL